MNHASTNAFLAAAIMVATAAQGAELSMTGNALRIKTETAEATGSFATGEVSLGAGELKLTGKGALLAIRPAGVVSRLLEGGADRYIGNGDVLAVQLRTKPGATVVALVNPSAQAVTARVPLGALGLTAPACAAYDFSSGAFAGPLAHAVARPLEGNEVVLLGVAEAVDRPVVLASTSDTRASWNAAEQTLSGVASVVAGKAYLLRILAPPLPTRWTLKSVTVKGGEATHAQDGACVRVDVTQATGSIAWTVAFSRGKADAQRAEPAKLTASPASHRCVALSSTRHGANIVLRRDDGMEFAMGEASLADTTVTPGRSYTYALHEVMWDGKQQVIAKATVKTPARPAPPPLPDLYLSDLKPVRAANGWNGDPRRDKSIEDNTLTIRGEAFKRGMGVHAPAELVYAVKPEYKRFVAIVGIDDETGVSGSVRFSLLADDRTLLKTPVLTGDDERFSINAELPAGTKQVRLVVDDGGNGIGNDHADWANAGFLTTK